MLTLNMFEGRIFFRFVVSAVLVLLLWNLAMLGSKTPALEVQDKCTWSPEDVSSIKEKGDEVKVGDEMEIPLLSTVPSSSFRRT